MQQTHIDFKQRRDLGSIISVYFDFFKMNSNPFSIPSSSIMAFLYWVFGHQLHDGYRFCWTIPQQVSLITRRTALETNPSLAGVLGFIFITDRNSGFHYSLAASIPFAMKSIQRKLPSKKVWALVSKNLGHFFCLWSYRFCSTYRLSLWVLSYRLFRLRNVGAIHYKFGFYGMDGHFFCCDAAPRKSVTDALGEGWWLNGKGFWEKHSANLVISFLLFTADGRIDGTSIIIEFTPIFHWKGSICPELPLPR